VTSTARVTVAGESMLIGGGLSPAASGEFLTVENPARRGSVITEIPRGGAADVDRAVKAAAAAWPAWSNAHWRERGRALLDIADAVDADLERLARLLATETGNAIRTQARPEIKNVVDIFRYFGGLASQLKGETIPMGSDALSFTIRESWGVVAAIVPWNAPAALAVLKIAPALAAGNTVVIKPSTDAPLTVLAIARMCAEHLPPGALNVVTGTGEEVGTPLAAHPLVGKLSFTGNTATGRGLLKLAADRIVPTTLELGGKSPAIVFPDANDDRAVAGVIDAMRFTRQGQSCTAGSRLLVHRSIFDEFVDRLGKALAKLRVGDPLDEATDIGAIINRQQFERVCAYVSEAAVQPGARLVVGGLPPTTGPLVEGYFAIPTVFADVPSDWRIVREEIFGPVLVALPWDDEDEAIRMANDTHYGLAAYVFTHDITKGLRAAQRIDAGWIQVNQGRGGVPGHSFGGYKQSGFGREFSLEGMLESYTQRKNITVNLER